MPLGQECSVTSGPSAELRLGGDWQKQYAKAISARCFQIPSRKGRPEEHEDKGPAISIT